MIILYLQAFQGAARGLHIEAGDFYLYTD